MAPGTGKIALECWITDIASELPGGQAHSVHLRNNDD